jgi:uncharacterized protein (DUF2249 family)
MADEYRVIKVESGDDPEALRERLQAEADERFEWVGVVPAGDNSFVVMNRPAGADHRW